MGLSKYDIEQAKVMFNDDGVKTADSVNEAKGLDFFGNPKDDDDDNSAIEKIAQENAKAIAAENAAKTSGPTKKETEANRAALSSLKKGSDDFQVI